MIKTAIRSMIINLFYFVNGEGFKNKLENILITKLKAAFSGE